MPLILAIEPDHRQASQLRAMARGRLGADLVHAESAEPALIALAGRVPDLILVPALLSPADETALGDYLRVLDAASSHVQTLIIPVLAANRPRSRRRGVLASLKRQPSVAPEGCDPKEFAEQCATYLERAAAERERRAEAQADAAADRLVDPVVEPLADPVVETFANPVVEAPAEPVVALVAEPEVEATIEIVAEPQPQRFIESPDELAAELLIEAVVETPEYVPEPSVEEDSVYEIGPPPRALEFIELDLSPLIEELSGPNLAIPTEAPVATAPIEDAAPPQSATLAVRETAPPATHSVEIVEVVEEKVAPLRIAVQWTAVYSPPGRWWPSMEGVTAEGESPVSHPASSRATVPPGGARKPAGAAVQDEWGFFDPSQCGFTALLSKLDEITTTDEAPGKQRA